MSSDSETESLSSLKDTTWYNLKQQNENRTLSSTEKVIELVAEMAKMGRSKLQSSLKYFFP